MTIVRRALIAALSFSASLAFGQIDSNSVTVTASRNVNLQADQAVFAVSVTSGLSTSLDDVVAALAGSGVTAANFSGVSSSQLIFTQLPNVVAPNTPPPTIQWVFNLPVPLSKIKDTVTALTNAQKNIAQKNSGLTLSFAVQGTQVSQQLLQSQTCVAADLIADARAQAQKLADAAGLSLGQILAMSSGVTSTIGSSGGSGSLLVGVSPIPPLYLCSVTVKFALIRLS